MRIERTEWTPITVTFETVEECQLLHKILAHVDDDTENRDLQDLMSLFINLGKGWSENPYSATGTTTLKDK